MIRLSFYFSVDGPPKANLTDGAERWITQLPAKSDGYNTDMAKNGPKGHGRKGEVKKRAQVLSSRNKRWTKVDTKTGRFVDQMAKKGRAFKGVKMK